MHVGIQLHILRNTAGGIVVPARGFPPLVQRKSVIGYPG